MQQKYNQPAGVHNLKGGSAQVQQEYSNFQQAHASSYYLLHGKYNSKKHHNKSASGKTELNAGGGPLVY